MGMSNYLENNVVDHVLRGQAFSPPGSLYFALLTSTHAPRENLTAYALDDTVPVLAGDGRWRLYKVTTAGTTAASQGALYSGVDNEVIADGSAVLTEQTAALDANTAAVEPSTGAYARVAKARSLANFSGTQGAGTTAVSSGSSGLITNNNAITWPTPTTDWGYTWGIAVYDALTAGNLWYWGGLAAVQNILADDSVLQSAGDVAISLTGAYKNYFRNKLLDFLFRAQSLGLPASLYVALMLDLPAYNTAGSEVATGSYARVALTRALTSWSGTQGPGTTLPSSGTSGESSNVAQVNFPVATANWGLVKSVEIMDAATGGNSLFFGALDAQKSILTGNSAPFPANSLKVRVDP